jgi:cystathionine beta-lyase/cystathionine gamma-synthase
MKFSTRAIHAGQPADPVTGATIIPLHMSSTFTQEEIGIHKGYDYSRSGNPTRSALEACLASLEEGIHGFAFASGLAAVMAVFSLLKPGEHVVASEDLYGGTYRLLEKILRPHQGISTTYTDARDARAVEKAIRKETRMVWIETPTNPLLHLADIAAIADICLAKGVLLAVDNTFATPYGQQPLKLEADIVVHSTTKYINGHSDVVGGVVVTDDDYLSELIRFYQNAAGAVPSPFDCWLTLRGVKTLAARMIQHQENALYIAGFLQQHPLVESVSYPGLEDHPQHALASRQMRNFGGMVSFRIRGGREEANLFFKNLKVFSFAESLGGIESLACYPATMTHGSVPEKERELRGITDATIRLSVGLEDKEDLIADLSLALSSAARIGRIQKKG